MSGPFGQVAPPPRGGGKSKAGLFIVLGAVGLVLVTALVGGLVIIKNNNWKAKHDVDAPAVAGGLPEADIVPGESPLYPLVNAGVHKADREQKSGATHVYRNGPTDARHILFWGGTARIGDAGGRNDFLADSKPVGAQLTSSASPGAGGGTAVCGELALSTGKSAYCAWATEDSFGILASNTPGMLVLDMQNIMQKMRPSLEKPI